MIRAIEHAFQAAVWLSGLAGGGVIVAQATVEAMQTDSWLQIIRELCVTGFALLVFMGVAWFCRRIVLFWEEHGAAVVSEWIANQKTRREAEDRRIALQAQTV